MKKFIFLLIMICAFPLLINATCTREGDQFRVSDADDGFTGLVTEGTGPYNYYCLNIGHCLAKDGKYYNINSEQVTLEQYYASCGCRIEGNTYYDAQGNETTQANYNNVCLHVGACSIVGGKYYDNNYNEVTQSQYEAVCGCRVDGTTYYDNTGAVTTEENYNRICLNVGACSIVNGHYYDNTYKEVTQSQYEAVCGCRVEGNTYYDNHGAVTTQANYNNVCLNIGACTIVDGKYYDNNYNEVTQEQFGAICGCRESGGKYYDKQGLETTQAIYEVQCVNPNTGVRNVLLILIPAIVLFLGGLFVINRRKQINEL